MIAIKISKMAASPMVGARVPEEWYRQIRAIALATNKTDADIVREALGQYLALHDPMAIKNVLDDHEERLNRLEQNI
jgi:predicted DNA-binding protein